MLHDLLLITTTLFDIYKYINFKAKKKVITQKGPNEWNYAPHPTLPNHPCSNTNVPTGLLVFFIMQVYGILQVFIPEKQVLAKIFIEPIKEASCLTEM